MNIYNTYKEYNSRNYQWIIRLWTLSLDLLIVNLKFRIPTQITKKSLAQIEAENEVIRKALDEFFNKSKKKAAKKATKKKSAN